MPQPLMPKKLKSDGSMMIYRPSRTNTKKDVLFIIEDWNAKVGSQEIPGVRGASSASGKGHEEGGLAYAKAGSSLRSLPGNS